MICLEEEGEKCDNCGHKECNEGCKRKEPDRRELKET
jgi:hypothetical protein